MKQLLKNTFLPALLVCCLAIPAFTQTCTVTFQADFRGVTAADRGWRLDWIEGADSIEVTITAKD